MSFADLRTLQKPGAGRSATRKQLCNSGPLGLRSIGRGSERHIFCSGVAEQCQGRTQNQKEACGNLRNTSLCDRMAPQNHLVKKVVRASVRLSISDMATCQCAGLL